MGKPRIDEIEQALIDAINADATISGYIKSNQVHILSERTLNFESGQLVVVPPAILIFYAGGAHESLEATKTLYRHRGRYFLIAAAQNLRGAKEAKLGGVGSEKGAYDVIEDLRLLFAGKELSLPSSTGVKPICILGDVAFEGTQRDLVAYSLELVVDSHWDKV